MNKTSSTIAGIIIVAVLVIGGYAIFHTSSKPAVGTTTQSKAAVNNAVLATKTSPTFGQYLATPSGQTLYTYGGDSSGVSKVTGSLLASWPAYQDTGATTGLPTNVGTMKRTDNGQIQYTYHGMPLYTFTSDSSGQVTGNGVSNFQVATPAAASSSPSTITTPAPSQPATSNTNPY